MDELSRLSGAAVSLIWGDKSKGWHMESILIGIHKLVCDKMIEGEVS
jgi:hypothetical protein